MVMERNEVVVGLDGSASAWAALQWTARYARYTFTDVRAIHAVSCTQDASWAWAGYAAATAGLVYAEPYEALIDLVARQFEAVDPEADWVLEHVVGPPGPVLVREAGQAQLLVVGTGEHGVLARLLSGSVSHYCLSHAACPVLAIPADPEPSPLALGPATEPTTSTAGPRHRRAGA
jgi:nucleotide-binding universal stress UspA family protein